MAGIGWAFAMLKLAPDLVAFLASNNYLPRDSSRMSCARKWR
jgi:hypothetical protein